MIIIKAPSKRQNTEYFESVLRGFQRIGISSIFRLNIDNIDISGRNIETRLPFFYIARVFVVFALKSD